MEIRSFYNKWATEKLKDDNRERTLKWKAVNLANLVLRNGINKVPSLCEIGGAEGILLNTFTRIIDAKRIVNFEISDVFCNAGRGKYKNIIYKNEEFSAQPDFFDMAILSDIIEHVENDRIFLEQVSHYCSQIAIKIPVEKSLFSSKLYYALQFRKKPLDQRYGLNHVNGHLRGYTIREAKKLVSMYFQILDYEITESSMFFNQSKRKKIFRILFGRRLYICLYGGSVFILGKTKIISSKTN